MVLGAVLCHCVAPHTVSTVHARSAVADGAVDSHWATVHQVRSAHVRSDVCVGAAVWYSAEAMHDLMTVHCRSEVPVAETDSN